MDDVSEKLLRAIFYKRFLWCFKKMFVCGIQIYKLD